MTTRPLAIGSIALLGLVGLAFGLFGNMYGRIASNDPIVSPAQQIADFSIKENVTGFAEDLFVATVTSGPRVENIGSIQRLMFTANTRETMKGEVGREVVLSLVADGRGNPLDGSPTLSVGETYLFGARTHESGEFSSVFAAEPTADGRDLSPNQRSEWRSAIQNATPYGQIVRGDAPARQSDGHPD